MSVGDVISKDFAQEELKTIVQFIEMHVHSAKSDDDHELARLNMIAAEALIESAHLVRALCERLSQE